ncbi:hypothetical protein pb186bvf_018266 [Paramecium bursaria]
MQKRQVILYTKVWQQENHGLFDHESKDIQQIEFVVDADRYLMLKNNKIYLNEQKDDDCIGQIVFQKDAIIFNCMQNIDTYLKLQPKRNYELQVGDLFKLGRMEYFVSELYAGKEIQDAPDKFKLNKRLIVDENEVKQCKFCLMESKFDPNNPYLQQLCKCIGNIKDVHFDCLKAWVNTRIERRDTGNTIQYEWDKAMECDVCKEAFPARIFVNQIQNGFHLIDIVRPEFPYIIFEQITRQQNLCKSLVQVHAANEIPIQIGRGHTCEIRCQDISVSRSHAEVQFLESWCIKDKQSKFGTLQIIHDQLRLKQEAQEIQIGRVLLNLKIEIF